MQNKILSLNRCYTLGALGKVKEEYEEEVY